VNTVHFLHPAQSSCQHTKKKMHNYRNLNRPSSVFGLFALLVPGAFAACAQPSSVTASQPSLPLSLTERPRVQLEEPSTPSAADTATDAATLTLQEALVLALRDNPQRSAARDAFAAALARVGTARSQGGLQVGASGTQEFDRVYGVQKPDVPGAPSALIDGLVNGFAPGSEGIASRRVASFDARLPVFSGGKVSAGNRQARFGAQSQAARLRQVEHDLILSTTLAYLGVLRAQQLQEVADSDVVLSRERVRVARVLLAGRLAAKLDVLRSQTTLSSALQKQIAARDSTGQAEATLNTLLGRAPETPLRLERVTELQSRVPLPAPLTTPLSAPLRAISTDIAPLGAGIPFGGAGETTNTPPQPLDPQNPVGAVSSVNLGTLRALAEAARPSLAASRAQIEAARAQVDVARAARRPSLGLDLTGLLRNPATLLGRFALSLGLVGAYTAFDSGRAGSQIAEAQALVGQEQNNLAGQRLNVGNAIEQARLSLEAAQSRLRSSDEAVIGALEGERVAQVGFRAGLKTGLDLSDAQNALIQTQTDAINTRFDFAGAQARLAAEVGVLTTEEQSAYERALALPVAAADGADVSNRAATVPRRRRRFLGIF